MTFAWRSRWRAAIIGFPVLWLFLFLVLGPLANAQERPLAVLPFELYHNRIYLETQINGQPGTVVLDNGASMSGVEVNKASALGIHSHGRASLTGNGERNSKIELGDRTVFTVGGLPIVEDKVVLLSFAEFEQYEGRSVDGILGVDLFRRYVVEIDYQTRTVRIFDPQQFHYKGSGEVLPLRIRGGAALIPVQFESPSGGAVDAEAGIDIGTYSALRLYRPYLESQKRVAPAGETVPSFGFGLGGEFRESEGRLQSLRIGKVKLDHPVTEFSTASGGATVSSAFPGTLGGEILRRFKIILDFRNARAIFEPNAAFLDPFSGDSTGLLFVARGADFHTIVVSHVLPGTPASEAGVSPGDIVKTFDGKDAGELGLERIRALCRKVGEHQLVLRRNDRSVQTTILARQLF